MPLFGNIGSFLSSEEDGTRSSIYANSTVQTTI